jgi:hypothetical protein
LASGGCGTALGVAIVFEYLVYEWAISDELWHEASFWITVGVLSVVFGFLGLVRFQRLMVILGTSLSGAIIVVVGLYYLVVFIPFGNDVPTWWEYMLFLRLALILFMAVSGMLLQVCSCRAVRMLACCNRQ